VGYSPARQIVVERSARWNAGTHVTLGDGGWQAFMQPQAVGRQDTCATLVGGEQIAHALLGGGEKQDTDATLRTNGRQSARMEV